MDYLALPSIQGQRVVAAISNGRPSSRRAFFIRQCRHRRYYLGGQTRGRIWHSVVSATMARSSGERRWEPGSAMRFQCRRGWLWSRR